MDGQAIECAALRPDCLDRLPEPALDIALAEQQTAFVADPVAGRLLRELAMPFSDGGVTRGT
jgi:hypothetical protein